MKFSANRSGEEAARCAIIDELHLFTPKIYTWIPAADAVYVGEELHHATENRHESPKMIINRENQYSMDVYTQFTDRFVDIIRFDNEKFICKIPFVKWSLFIIVSLPLLIPTTQSTYISNTPHSPCSSYASSIFFCINMKRDY